MADESERGGPKTPEGKAVSSQNSRKHGMRARNTLILPDEDPAEYEATRLGWLQEFEPEGYREERLVEALIKNDWMYKRGVRRLMEAEADVVDEENTRAVDWTAEQRHTIELMQRYKTTNERAFYRSLNACEQIRKDLMRIELLKDRFVQENRGLRKENLGLKHENEDLKEKIKEQEPAIPEPAKPSSKACTAQVTPPKTRAQELFQGQKSRKKQKKIQTLEQWVEVTVEDGVTYTALSPSNANLIKLGQRMCLPPDMVYRRLNFVNGVPPEYHWTTRHDSIRASGGAGIQRMDVNTWLELIDREAETGTGHIGPCGGNAPRPEERGGCECEVCEHNRKILEARGA